MTRCRHVSQAPAERAHAKFLAGASIADLQQQNVRRIRRTTIISYIADAAAAAPEGMDWDRLIEESSLDEATSTIIAAGMAHSLHLKLWHHEHSFCNSTRGCSCAVRSPRFCALPTFSRPSRFSTQGLRQWRRSARRQSMSLWQQSHRPFARRRRPRPRPGSSLSPRLRSAKQHGLWNQQQQVAPAQTGWNLQSRRQPQQSSLDSTR